MDFVIKKKTDIFKIWNYKSKQSYNILLLSNIGKERLGQVYLNINNDWQLSFFNKCLYKSTVIRFPNPLLTLRQRRFLHSVKKCAFIFKVYRYFWLQIAHFVINYNFANPTSMSNTIWQHKQQWQQLYIRLAKPLYKYTWQALLTTKSGIETQLDL